MFKKRPKRKAATATRNGDSSSESGPELETIQPIKRSAVQEKTKLTLAELEDRYFLPDVQAIKEITLDDLEPQDDISLESDWEDLQLAKSGHVLARNHSSLVLPSLDEIRARLDRHLDQLERRRQELEQIIHSKNKLLSI